MTKTDDNQAYRNSNAIAWPFLLSSAIGLVILLLDGIFLGIARMAPEVFPGWATEFWQVTFQRGRPIHLQFLIFLWLSMALMGAMYYVVPRMVKADLFSKKMGYLHLALQWVGGALIGLSLHFGYTEGREYLEPVLLLDLAVVIIWVLFFANIFITILKKGTDYVHPGLKFVLLSILYLGLNFVIANFIPLNGLEDDVMIYTFAHNEVNGWFMFGLQGIMYWALPVFAGLKAREVYSQKLSNWHFWLVAILIPPSVFHHFLYDATPVINFWKQMGEWSSVGMLAPTAIWVYIVYTVLKKRQARLNTAGKFFVASTVFYALNCVQGAAQSIISVNEGIHQTQWVVGHAHLALIGFISMGVFGMIYQVYPAALSKATVWSEKMGTAHLVLAVAGMLLIWLPLSIGGIYESYALANGKEYADIQQMLAPYFRLRMFGGTLFLSGAVLLVINTYKTLAATELVEVRRRVKLALTRPASVSH